MILCLYCTVLGHCLDLVLARWPLLVGIELWWQLEQHPVFTDLACVSILVTVIMIFLLGLMFSDCCLSYGFICDLHAIFLHANDS